jgi:hypothetical protein
MCARGIERWEECLERSACRQNVINQEHAGSWRNLKAATELATSEPVVTTHLFSKEAANAEESANLVGQQHATRRWTNDEINIATKLLDYLEALHCECARDLCGGRWMLQ